MIAASSPVFTVIFARIFIKENIFPIDIINILLVFLGIVHIVKPAFLFGVAEIYTSDPEAIYAVISWILSNVFLMANVFVLLRMLKGKPCMVVIRGLLRERQFLRAPIKIIYTRRSRAKVKCIAHERSKCRHEAGHLLTRINSRYLKTGNV